MAAKAADTAAEAGTAQEGTAQEGTAEAAALLRTLLLVLVLTVAAAAVALALLRPELRPLRMGTAAVQGALQAPPPSVP